jgi:hypothetical protein
MRDKNAGIGTCWVFEPRCVWPSNAKIEICDLLGPGRYGTMDPFVPFVILDIDDRGEGAIKILYQGKIGWILMKNLGACKPV